MSSNAFSDNYDESFDAALPKNPSPQKKDLLHISNNQSHSDISNLNKKKMSSINIDEPLAGAFENPVPVVPRIASDVTF